MTSNQNGIYTQNNLGFRKGQMGRAEQLVAPRQHKGKEAIDHTAVVSKRVLQLSLLRRDAFLLPWLARGSF